MRSLPILAFLLFLALAFFAFDERAQLLVGASADGGEVGLLGRLSGGVQTIQHAAGEGRKN